MKVQMRVKITGTRDGAEWPEIGEEITLPDTEAADLCAAGLASPVAEPEKPETRKKVTAEKV